MKEMYIQNLHVLLFYANYFNPFGCLFNALPINAYTKRNQQKPKERVL